MVIASVRQRILAFLLDYLVIALYIIFLFMIGVGLGMGPLQGVFRTMFANPNISEVSAFLLLVLPVILYFTLFECSSWQATWGKRKLGLHVIDKYGERLTLPISFVRSIFKFLPWELTHACLWRIPGWPFAPTTPSPIIMAGLALVWILVAAYLISMLTNEKHRTLYDLIAGTSVIDVKHPN